MANIITSVSCLDGVLRCDGSGFAICGSNNLYVPCGSGSSSAAVPCGDCTGCNPAGYRVNVSGLGGTFDCSGTPTACTAINSDGSYALTSNFGCTWVNSSAGLYCPLPGGVVDLICTGSTWTVRIYDFPTVAYAAIWTAPNVDGCPPVTGWVRAGGTCTGGTITVTPL